MTRKPRRGLSAEEQQLWSRVIETAEPLAGSTKTFEKPLESVSPLPVSKPIKSFEIGQGNSTNPAIGTDFSGSTHRASKAQVEMDAKAFKRMRAGKLKPERRLDLHGMTLDEAHPRLNQFILDAFDHEKRLVLVITGKGKRHDDGGPIPTRMGVLRQQVPLWLRQFPLSSCVLQIDHANQRHGGIGAYYVYLRRKR